MKIHFAGGGTNEQGLIRAGVNYRLQTFYDIHKRKAKFDINIFNSYEHFILDSGLFTMMFGSEAKKGIELTEERILKWMEDLIDFINKTPFRNASFVECDVQKKLSPEYAWHLRKEMKRRINKGTVMNVYHLEDGNPDKLIAFSDYIAVSLPELRFNVSDKERYQITKYISSKAVLKGKRVHLLGCTEEKYLQDFSYCYSCDSTSWQSGFRYGWLPSKIFGIISMKDLQGQVEDKKNREEYIFWSALFSLMDYKQMSKNQK